MVASEFGVESVQAVQRRIWEACKKVPKAVLRLKREKQCVAEGELESHRLEGGAREEEERAKHREK